MKVDNIVNILGKFTLEQDKKTQRGYRTNLSITSALDVGGWSKLSTSRFTPKKDTVPNV